MIKRAQIRRRGWYRVTLPAGTLRNGCQVELRKSMPLYEGDVLDFPPGTLPVHVRLERISDLGYE